ncbi:MAG: hypothetical protein KY469_10680 [Actinobacteria bacterium]|nr:hypothetical protein [Actinomycetota bacterium]
MLATEWRDLVETMNGLWPGSRPLTEVATKVWWDELRDLDASSVKRALSALARDEDRRPSLAVLREKTIAGTRAAAPAPAAPTVPRPSRCSHVIGTTDPRKGTVAAMVCRGSVAWTDAGEGWITGVCDECSCSYAHPPTVGSTRR